MPRGSRSAPDARARCEGPAEEFIGFARGLLAARSDQRLQALAASPAAEVFARRLVQEALSGAAHAATCMTLITRLGKDPSWAQRLQQPVAASQLPAADALTARELEAVGRGLLVICPQQALAWIAGAYLRLKPRPLAALEKLLLTAALTPQALAGALDAALGLAQSAGRRAPEALLGRSIEVLEKQARQLADRSPAAEERPLVQLTRAAGRTETARLLSALLVALLETPDAPSSAARAPEPAPTAQTAIAEAAWSDADEALGRALQDMDFLSRSFDRLEAAALGAAADPARRARNASNLVLQWVLQAARFRRVAVLNKPGDRVPFDPAVHELDGEADVGELVRIVKPAVVRGSAPQQVVLLRAEAAVD